MLNRRVFLLSIAALAVVAHPGTGHGAKQNAGGKPMSMLEKLVYVTVFVKDQEKALDFYTNALGFEKRADQPATGGGGRFLAVGLKGQDFLLVLWPGTPGQGQPFQGRSTAAYTIETKDIRKAVEIMKSHGVKFETDVLEYPWGWVSVFKDPDGNTLQLRQGR